MSLLQVLCHDVTIDGARLGVMAGVATSVETRQHNSSWWRHDVIEASTSHVTNNSVAKVLCIIFIPFFTVFKDLYTTPDLPSRSSWRHGQLKRHRMRHELWRKFRRGKYKQKTIDEAQWHVWQALQRKQKLYTNCSWWRHDVVEACFSAIRVKLFYFPEEFNTRYFIQVCTVDL